MSDDAIVRAGKVPTQERLVEVSAIGAGVGKTVDEVVASVLTEEGIMAARVSTAPWLA